VGSDRLKVLSTVELNLARQLASGMTNEEIAAARQVSRRAIEVHVYHLRKKLGVDRSELIELLRNELPPRE
jgi:DNA-binding CsgD family transcriptional regulator